MGVAGTKIAGKEFSTSCGEEIKFLRLLSKGGTPCSLRALSLTRVEVQPTLSLAFTIVVVASSPHSSASLPWPPPHSYCPTLSLLSSFAPDWHTFPHPSSPQHCPSHHLPSTFWLPCKLFTIDVVVHCFVISYSTANSSIKFNYLMMRMLILSVSTWAELGCGCFDDN